LLSAYTAAGTYTFTTSPLATSVYVKCWGAGGGGQAGSAMNPGAGGAGGGYAEGFISVTANTAYTITVGAGGAGGVGASGVGAAGTASSFGSSVTANGGAGGAGGHAAGGTATGGTINITGQNGQVQGIIQASQPGSSGGAGGNSFGMGGAGHTCGLDATDGDPATHFGCGGGGGNNGGNYPGGAATDGAVLIYYTTTAGSSGGGAASTVLNNLSQGRLTLTSNVPVTTSDVTAATTLYFTPYKGNGLTLYTNSNWQNYTFSQISIAVPATTNHNYDVFVYDLAGVVTLILVAWTNQTTRATALTTQDGVYTLTGHTNYRYLGTFATTGVSGQTEDSIANRFLWNYYNRVNRTGRHITASTRWIYSTNAWHQANADASNQANLIIGIVEDSMRAFVFQNVASSTGAQGIGVGIGLNSTTVNSAQQFGNNTTATNVFCVVTCEYNGTDYSIGLNNIVWLEIANNAVATWCGTDVGITGVPSGMGITVNLPM